MNGWSIPAVWIFIVAQASAAVWWASGTDTQVGQNSTSIVQVIQNEKQIAVMGAQQEAIAEDVIEVKIMVKDLQKIKVYLNGTSIEKTLIISNSY